MKKYASEKLPANPATVSLGCQGGNPGINLGRVTAKN
jgi:hypothetical protein